MREPIKHASATLVPFAAGDAAGFYFSRGARTLRNVLRVRKEWHNRPVLAIRSRCWHHIP